MTWSIGYDTRWRRDIGYGVPAFCDHPGCTTVIDRGLSYVCGGEPCGGDHGCGLYFCLAHMQRAGGARAYAQVCTRCRHGRSPYEPSLDHPDWICWKLTDHSWARWRTHSEPEVRRLKAQLLDYMNQKDATDGNRH